MGEETGLPGRSIRGQVIAVVMFVAITAGLMAAYSRAFGPGDGAPGSATSSSARGSMLMRARQFHADLRASLGNNARGVPVVSAVDYDEATDRLHVVLSLDHTLRTPAEARGGAMRRVLSVLEAYRTAGFRCESVLVTATAPARDRLGRVGEATVVRCQFPRDRLDGADWPRLAGKDVPDLASQFWLHPDLEPPAQEAPPTTQAAG